MKLPQPLEGIHRSGRIDMVRPAGVDPAFLGGVWNWVKKNWKKVGCPACDLIPNATAKAACKAVACR